MTLDGVKNLVCICWCPQDLQLQVVTSVELYGSVDLGWSCCIYFCFVKLPTFSIISIQIAVERVQRRATRLVISIWHLDYQSRLHILKLPSLYYRQRRGDMINMYKMLRGGVDVDAAGLLTLNSAGRTRGHSIVCLFIGVRGASTARSFCAHNKYFNYYLP